MSQDVVSQQLKLLPLVRMLAMVFVMFGVLPQLALTLAPYLAGGRHQARIVTHASTVRAILGLVDFVVLVTKCQEFKKCLLNLKCRRFRAYE